MNPCQTPPVARLNAHHVDPANLLLNRAMNRQREERFVA
jgi:hypothetical protein